MVNKDQTGAIYQAGFEEEMNIVQQQLASSGETLTTAAVSNTVATLTTQTLQTAKVTAQSKKHEKSVTVEEGVKVKNSGSLRKKQMQTQHSPTFQLDEIENCQMHLNSPVTLCNARTHKCAHGTVLVDYWLPRNSEAESNHDVTPTLISLAYAAKYEEFAELLIKQKADTEQRDAKGNTPLIIAANFGYKAIVDILLKNGADIEAQSDSKDTPLSAACLEGNYEVAKLLLKRGANKEARNICDCTPLNLAALRGNMGIIKLLLEHGAEINAHTGSKLSISPLMSATVNGHTAAVKLLLNMGSDVNAQTKVNCNTALILACSEGHPGVVRLLLDRKANLEHKTAAGLTPLMTAASGGDNGHVEVGRILIERGADVNATSGSYHQDTSLTIAAERGCYLFVNLLLKNGAAVEKKTKGGASPLWLAALGGYLDIITLLYNNSADINSQDAREVSCLMIAFQSAHVKVVKWMVNYVTQLPSEAEIRRGFFKFNDTKLLTHYQECVQIIKAAKETQAAKADKRASTLLKELDMEKNREESKKAAAARRRERKKKKKLEKKGETYRLIEENKTNEKYNKDDDQKNMDEDTDKLDDEENLQERTGSELPIDNGEVINKEGDRETDVISDNVKTKIKQKERKKKKSSQTSSSDIKKSELEFRGPLTSAGNSVVTPSKVHALHQFKDRPEMSAEKSHDTATNLRSNQTIKKDLISEATLHPAQKRYEFEAIGNKTYVPARNKKSHLQHYSETLLLTSKPSPTQLRKREEGGNEVVKKSSVQTVTANDSGVRKITVPFYGRSRVIRRGGGNNHAIRGATGTHIEVEKQSKGQGERIISLQPVEESTQAPETNKSAASTLTLGDIIQLGTGTISVKVMDGVSQSVTTTTTAQQKTLMITTPSTTAQSRSTAVIKPSGSIIATVPQITAPHLVTQAQRNSAAQLVSNTKTNICYTSPLMATATASTKVVTTTAAQTYAAKLPETTSSSPMPLAWSQIVQYQKTKASPSFNVSEAYVEPLLPQASMQAINNQTLPKLHHSTPIASVPPNIQHYQALGKLSPLSDSSTQPSTCTGVEHSMIADLRQCHSFTPQPQPTLIPVAKPHVEALPATQISNNLTSTMKKDNFIYCTAQQPTWIQENEIHKPINFAALTERGPSQTPTTKFVDDESPPQVEAWKAPGYRRTAMGSRVSAKTSSNSTTPFSLSLTSGSNYQSFPELFKNEPLPSNGTNIMHNQSASQANQHDMFSNYYYSVAMPSRSMQHAHSDKNLYKSGSASFEETTATNMLSMPTNNVQQHLLPLYHQVQHLNYSEPQQQSVQISAAPLNMSPLNPEVSNFVTHALPNEQPPQIYNEYAMGNQNNSTFYAMNNHKSDMGTPQSRLPLWQIQQPLSQQQSELSNRMAGMTLHSTARTVGGEILENAVKLGTVNSSPAMSPNLPPSHNLHPSDGHYIEDRKQPTAREYQNPNMDNNCMMSNDSEMIMDRQCACTDHYNALLLNALKRDVPLENFYNYESGAPVPTFFLQQQQRWMQLLELHSACSNMTNLQDKPHTGTISVKVMDGVSQSVTTTTTAQQKTLMITTPSTTAQSRSTAVIKPSGSIIATVPQITAPHLVTQAQRNSAAQLVSNTKTNICYTSPLMATATASTKVVTTTAAQTYAAKLPETTSSSPMPLAWSQIVQYQKTKASPSFNVSEAYVEPLLPQASMQAINNQTLPKLHHPTPIASVPPNIQHYQALGKLSPLSDSSTQPSTCTGVEHSMIADLRQCHSFTPQPQPTLIPVAKPHVEALPATQISNNLTSTMKKDNFIYCTAQQPTWIQENEIHKPINFAALTERGPSQTPTTKFVDDESPPQVEAWKAPGYRRTAMGSRVSAKTSSNSTTPFSLSLTSGSNYQSFPELFKNEPLPSNGTNIMHNQSASQANQHDMFSNYYYSVAMPSRSMQHAHSDKNLYKSGSASFEETTATNMLSMPTNNVQQHLLPLYHQVQHLNYSEPQQQSVQISAAPLNMSPLNPEVSNFVTHALPNEQPPQIYNEYAMGNQNNSTFYAMNNHKSDMGTPQSRLPLWQIQQPLSQQQSELSNRMAGMTLHSTARTVGGEILENAVKLGTVNSSPAMSPNLPPSHNLHPSDGHYIEDRKQPTAREYQNPNMDNNCMMSNDSEMIMDRQCACTDHYNALLLNALKRDVPLENFYNYESGAPVPTFFLQQQQRWMQLLELHSACSNMTNLQDKPHE